jgi:gliding motility-associated-like protein
VAGPTCQTTLYITIGTGTGNPSALFTSTTVCVGTPTQFTDTSPVSGITSWKWDFNNDGTPDDTTQNPTYTFAAVGTYPVKLTIAAGACGADTTMNVTVIASSQPTLTAVGPFCANASAVTLTASITGGTWSGSGITNASTGTFDPTQASAGNDTITYTLSGSCTSSATQVIVVNALPVANAGPNAFLCTGGSANIGTTATAGYTYSWAPSGGLNNTNIANPIATLTNLSTTPINTTYTVVVVETATSCQSSDSVVVTVMTNPTANAGSSQTVCKGSSITLAGAVSGSATSGVWSGGTGTYSPDNSTLNGVYTPSAAEYAADSVTLTLTTNDPPGPCTFSSSNVTFYFYHDPIVNFSGDAPAGCPIHCINFSDSSVVPTGTTIQSWTWDFGDGSPGDNVQNPAHCFPTSGFYDIKLIITSSNGCTSYLTKTQFVEIYDVPIAEFTPSPNPATILDPLISFNNESSSDVSYWHWDFGDSTSLAPNISSPDHSYGEGVTGNFIVTLIVHNAHNCYDTIAHSVSVGPAFTFFIPNAFTPNADGTNDYFFGSGIGIKQYNLWIFDRWGNKIFHGKRLDDKWDGKANDGSQAAQVDVYIWKVTLTDIFNKDHDFMGTVTLVR